MGYEVNVFEINITGSTNAVSLPSVNLISQLVFPSSIQCAHCQHYLHLCSIYLQMSQNRQVDNLMQATSYK